MHRCVIADELTKVPPDNPPVSGLLVMVIRWLLRFGVLFSMSSFPKFKQKAGSLSHADSHPVNLCPSCLDSQKRHLGHELCKPQENAQPLLWARPRDVEDPHMSCGSGLVHNSYANSLEERDHVHPAEVPVQVPSVPRSIPSSMNRQTSRAVVCCGTTDLTWITFDKRPDDTHRSTGLCAKGSLGQMVS